MFHSKYTFLALAITFSTLQLTGQSTPTTPPAVKAVLSQTIEQTKVTDCTNAAQIVPWGNSTALHLTQDGLSVGGRDLQGNTWSTVLPASGVMKCEVWSAVLRKGYPADLLFLSADSMGDRYNSELTILFFDKSGRPHPWQARGGFTSTSAGISQLASDKTTGFARLVVPIREGERSAGFVYVHNLFQTTPTGVAKVVGLDTNTSWPLVSGNQKALVGTESKATNSESFDASETVDQTKTLKLSNVLPLSEDERLVYSDGTKTRFPSIVVIDHSNGSRQIFFDQNVTDGVEQIQKGAFALHLKGTTCEEDECRPFIIVAKQQ